MAQPVVLVDAENVRRSTWPNIEPLQLIESCQAWAERMGLSIELVLEGQGVEETRTPCLTVVSAGEESADRWIVRRAQELRKERRPFWLVTSDRALREDAGRGAERVVGGGTFARELARGQVLH